MKPVLVDTSVWVAHFRLPSAELQSLLAADRVLIHPLVIGELACGTPPQRARTLTDLRNLAQARRASLDEVIDFIEREQLFGLGCGLIDLTLLASTLITPGAELWTLDRRLAQLAQRMAILHVAAGH
ncbi:type II toxin-antitoxin system VapC family toxin [Derxia gummosa]|uniref:Type II toxin-antitoxin system VapC family toxin n=1 Tax=Derxia gummosa DSM 723 TaxID=1121388 RepID=A0A8B6X2L6_9BURK|nr:PIN domain-containing protein [Derxia gummosa]